MQGEQGLLTQWSLVIYDQAYCKNTTFQRLSIVVRNFLVVHMAQYDQPDQTENYSVSTMLVPEVHWGICGKDVEREGCYTTLCMQYKNVN